MSEPTKPKTPANIVWTLTGEPVTVKDRDGVPHHEHHWYLDVKLVASTWHKIGESCSGPDETDWRNKYTEALDYAVSNAQMLYTLSKLDKYDAEHPETTLLGRAIACLRKAEAACCRYCNVGEHEKDCEIGKVLADYDLLHGCHSSTTSGGT